jgi:LmbE family N-acetylglucosaminyl deacetylase
MADALRLLAVLAHPDDETLGIGGTLAHCAAEGIETFLLTATRGERGRFFDNGNRPSDAEVGRVREAELRAAAAELGVTEVTLLDYLDKELDQAEVGAAVARIAAEIACVRPQVVITFPNDGAYGHPDHIAISQLTGAAITTAAPQHRVSKLYWFGSSPTQWELYQRVFKRLVSVVDGVERAVNPWPEWLFTTRLDVRAQWPRVWRAVQRHETQMAIYGQLGDLTDAEHRELWGDQRFYRVFSTVNGGRAIETDLFTGLR